MLSQFLLNSAVFHSGVISISISIITAITEVASNGSFSSRTGLFSFFIFLIMAFVFMSHSARSPAETPHLWGCFEPLRHLKRPREKKKMKPNAIIDSAVIKKKTQYASKHPLTNVPSHSHFVFLYFFNSISILKPMPPLGGSSRLSAECLCFCP